MTTVLAKSLKMDALTALSGDFRNEGKEDYEDEEIKEDDENEDGGAWVCGVWKAINGQECILTKPSSSNRQLFNLARRVVASEKRRGKKLSTNQYLTVFKQWESASRLFLRSGNDYLSEFLAKLSSVKIPAGETLEAAFRKAQGTQAPEKLREYPNTDVQLFGSLCRELHSMSNGQQIMLAQQPIAELFGCDPRTISNWIRALMTLDLLKLDKKGFKGKSASTYFYQE
jgi:hypothetical protein